MKKWISLIKLRLNARKLGKYKFTLTREVYDSIVEEIIDKDNLFDNDTNKRIYEGVTEETFRKAFRPYSEKVAGALFDGKSSVKLNRYDLVGKLIDTCAEFKTDNSYIACFAMLHSALNPPFTKKEMLIRDKVFNIARS